MTLTGKINVKLNGIDYSITSEWLIDHDLVNKSFCVIKGSNGYYNDNIRADALEEALCLIAKGKNNLKIFATK